MQAGEREVKQQQHQPKSPMIFVVPNSGQKPQVGEVKKYYIGPFSYPDLIWDSHELNISPNISTIHR